MVQMIPVKEWRDVTIGMWADEVLKIHPNTEWIRKKPTVLIDVRSKNKKIPDLIVTWHYQEADIVLERAMVNNPLFGSISAYAVQQILLKEKPPDGHDGERSKHQSQGRGKKRRKIRR